MNEQKHNALASFRKQFLSFNIDAIEQEADNMVATGVTVKQFLDTCTPAMAEIGDKFEKGEYYLPHLIMAGEMFKAASAKVKQSMAPGDAGNVIARVVLGTPKGDLHNLGKDIFGVLAEASGFAVYNLGVDVPAENFIAGLEETGSTILGLSTLLTTTFETIEEIVSMMERRGLRKNTHIILGGGATEKSLVEKLGVDYQTRDAYEGITILKNLTDGEMEGGGS